jgi:alpha-tubulin suppressor-like RCC1 family protein
MKNLEKQQLGKAHARKESIQCTGRKLRHAFPCMLVIATIFFTENISVCHAQASITGDTLEFDYTVDPFYYFSSTVTVPGSPTGFDASASFSFADGQIIVVARPANWTPSTFNGFTVTDLTKTANFSSFTIGSVSGGVIPDLSFTTNSLTVNFTPNGNSNPGIDVTYVFNFTLSNGNQPPIVQSEIPDQGATLGVPFSFAVPTNTFVEPDFGQTLTLSATGLPPGIVFDSASGILSGTPTATGTFSVTITATDNGSPPLSASTTFNVVVSSLIVRGWGYDGYGQLGNGSYNNAAMPMPVNLANTVSVAAGAYHTLLLEADGTVWAAGGNFYGQLGNGGQINSALPVQVPDMTNVVAVAAGYYHSLVLKADGTVWAWGYNYDGELGNGTFSTNSSGSYWIAAAVQVMNLSNVVAIAAGSDHSLALKADGTVWCWGYGGDGELGDGVSYNIAPNGSALPVQARNLVGIAKIAAGEYHSLAVSQDGHLWAWGANWDGQLGTGNFATMSTPILVPGFNNVVSVSGGYAHTLAAKSDGTVWSWGYGSYGQLGNGAFSSSGQPMPQMIPGLTGVTAVAASSQHSLALGADGTLWAWGDGQYGELGNGAFFTQSSVPVQVCLPSSVKAISAGPNDNFAISDVIQSSPCAHPDHVTVMKNSLPNVVGVLANDGDPDGDPLTIVAVSQGTYGSVAIVPGGTNLTYQPLTDFVGNDSFTYTVSDGQGNTDSATVSVTVAGPGTVVTWGYNAYGELGDGTLSGVNIPEAIAITGVTAVSAGGYHTLFLMTNGTISACGANWSGQLGNGSFNQSSTPVSISGLSGVTSVASGWDNSLALRSDGTVWAWGASYYGQLGNGAFNSSSTPIQVPGLSGIVAIAAGTYHNLALRADGTVWAWGYNYYGQIGNGTVNNSAYPYSVATPVQVPGLSEIAGIAAGAYHSLALKSDGTVWCWGYGGNGQIGNGAYSSSNPNPIQALNVTGATSIFGASFSSFALTDAENMIWTWGDYQGGATPVPVFDFSAGFASVGGALNHNLILKRNGELLARRDDNYGQLGDGAFFSYTHWPVQVRNIRASAYAAGGAHSVAILSEANRPPAVIAAIPDQTATYGSVFYYILPQNTFQDQDGEALRYTASGLPPGLYFNGSTVSGTPTAVGAYTVTITATDSGSPPASTNTTFKITVNPAALTITANDQTKTYGQTVTFGGTEFIAGGLVNGDTVTSVNLASAGAAASATVNGSPYSIVASAAMGMGLSNYSITYVNGALTINQGTPVLTWAQPGNITYPMPLNSQPQPGFPFVQLNASANVQGTFVYSPAAGTVLNSGRGQVLQVTFTPTDTVNYSSATASTTITVDPGYPVITWPNPADIVYGTPLGSAQLNATASGNVFGDTVAGTFTYSPAAGTVLNAGANQQLRVDFTPADTNYLSSGTFAHINVLKATPSITWSQPGNITYPMPLQSSAQPGFPFVQLNAAANMPGTFSYSPPAGTVLNTGRGQVLQATFTPTDTANYTTTTTTTTITVDPGYPVMTWPNPADIIYGTPLGSAQLNATTAGNVFGTAVAGTFTYIPPAGTILNAGSNQQLRVDFTPADTNYLSNGTFAHINVLKATPVIAWANPSDFVYGVALGSGQLNATANVPGTLTYGPPAGTVLGAGSNQILSVTFTPADSANYNTASNAVTVNVLKRDLTVTADNGSRLYGGANPSVAIFIVGARLGDDFLANTTSSATPTSPVGTYPIVPSLVDISGALSNYNAAYVNGTLTVKPAPLAVNVNNQSKAYGAPVPALTGAVVGIVNGDNITANYITATTQSSPVGVYDIGVTLNDPSGKLGNYAVVINKGSLTVTPVPLGITANNQTKVYGNANPALTVSFAGFVNGETAASLTSQPIANTSVSLGTSVGTYPITVSGAASPNYTMSYTNGTFTVTPAPLKVTAADASKQYSDPLPTFTATYKGFVLNDGPGSLSGTLGFSTPATILSAPGTYKISCSGLSSPNYSINFANGSLTTTPEDARTTYTGPTAVKTTSPSKGNFSVTLTASIKDINALPTDPAWDAYPGNISNAIVAFVDRSSGATLVGNVPVTTNGLARAVWNGSIGNLSSKTYTIGTVVTGYYTRNSATENATVTISH